MCSSSIRNLFGGSSCITCIDYIEFGLSLDELIKGDVAVKKKIIADSSAKKWHILVIVYLLAIVAYIAYFAVCHRILMIGFLIATLFMLFFELRIFIKEKIYRQNRNCHAE